MIYLNLLELDTGFVLEDMHFRFFARSQEWKWRLSTQFGGSCSDLGLSTVLHIPYIMLYFIVIYKWYIFLYTYIIINIYVLYVYIYIYVLYIYIVPDIHLEDIIFPNFQISHLEMLV